MTRIDPARRGRAVRTGSEEAGLVWWGLAYLAAAAALAAFAAWPIHESWRVWLVAAVGAAVGIGSAALARRIAPGALGGALVTAAFTALGYLLVVVPVAVPSALLPLSGVARGLRDGITGVVLGWKQVLTLEPPLGEYQAVLVPWLVVVTVCSAVAASLIVRGGRVAPVAAAPAIAMSVYGIAFGVGRVSAPIRFGELELPAAREVVIGVASLALAAGWLIGRSRMLRARALARARAGTVTRSGESVWMTLRRNALAVVLLVVALVAGVAASPAVASFGDRSTLRDEIEPSIVVQRQQSPLAKYRSWFAGDAYDTTVVKVSGDVGSFDRLPFATLDTFDGEVFGVDPATRYSRLPGSADRGAGTAEISVEIGEGYSGVWVPAPSGLAASPVFVGARAERLADGFHAASTGGAIEVAEGSATDSAAGSAGAVGLMPGDRYSVVARIPDASADAAREAFASAAGADGGLDPEEFPSLAAWVELQEVPRTGAGYLDLVDRLRDRGYLSHALLDDEPAVRWITALASDGGYSFLPSYAGHSRARIESLFAELGDQQRRAGANADESMLIAGEGDDEQFAVAAALVARDLGFESRVVLGMRLPGAEPVPGIAVCESDCTGAAMTAWVEVRAGGGGWVAVDTTPQSKLLPTRITEGEQPPKHPTVPDDARTEPIEPPRGESASTDSAPPPVIDPVGPTPVTGTIVRSIVLGVGALALLALPILAMLAAKSTRRRSRRHPGDPELGIVGAWEELLDLYADAGIEVDLDPGVSRATAALSTGRAAAVALAVSVDHAVFAPYPPEPEAAVHAWELVDAEREALRGEERAFERLRAALTPRSFLARLRRRPRLPLVRSKEITQ
ncbi:transglutaminase domain-containing protein [Agromyces protaetiae]|uniref:Transglutaminase domain-containing protein n=1 Tax=Agromyces protaetiae TaxID=2509455 RepID=A0A4P6FNS5_9MICO|nr:transglutaminase-like domain-containing protein [Agromyces protaetiae]QAY72128.1 transglutaminase domain-containing protein [Agromyces protaetiae]